MNNQSVSYLSLMGIQAWQLKTPTSPLKGHTLQQSVKNCTASFGTKNPRAELMLIGEVPDDQEGKPFVDRAGQLLNAMLGSIGIRRETVYIANTLKYHPPENHDPLSEKITSCTEFLEKQIALVQPKLLVALGPIAAQYLLGSKESLANLRQQTHYYGKTPLIVTYHPTHLLRNPSDKGKAFQDLQMIFTKLTQTPGVPAETGLCVDYALQPAHPCA